MKKCIIIATVLILSGCASTQNAFKENVTEESKFHFNSVSVNIGSRCPAEDKYFTNEQVQSIFEGVTKIYFCSKRLCTDTPSEQDIVVDIQVVYTRLPSGEGFIRFCNVNYLGAMMDYSYTLTKNGKVFFSASDSNLMMQRGSWDTFKRLVTIFTGRGSKKEEKDDLSNMTAFLAHRISKGY